MTRAAQIQHVVAEHYGVTVDQLHGKCREQRIAHARHVAIYLTRELTRLSLAQIGNEFGGRDHTTVINSLRRAVMIASPERIDRIRKAVA